MASWVLIPCLKQLMAEFNAIAPGRDHASDGTIGDAAHQQEVSDHNPDETGSVPVHDADHINEVHAIDVDDDLRESDLTMEKVVQFILSRCRKSNSDPNNEARLRYIIYNRRIWDYRSNWVQKAYTGPSPHTEHAHFSADYDSKLEADTSSWHLEDIPVALTAADKTWIQQQNINAIASVTTAVKAAIEARVGDVVPRWTNDGTNLPDGTADPTMVPASALFYIGASARRIENSVIAIADQLNTANEPPVKPTA